MLLLLGLALGCFAFVRGFAKGSGSLFSTADKSVNKDTFTFPTAAEAARTRRKFLGEAKVILAADAVALALKRRQLIFRDAYGENREAWDLEIQRYLKRRPRLGEIARTASNWDWDGFTTFKDFKDTPVAP